MKITRYVIAFSFLLLGISLFAQNKNKPRIVKHKGITTLAGGEFKGGNLSKNQFDSLIQLPLWSWDSIGQPHPVLNFFFTFVERKLYEDSIGHPIILPDYYGFQSDQGKIPQIWITTLLERAKEGDTILITNVESFFNDSLHTKFYTEPIKIVLTE